MESYENVLARLRDSYEKESGHRPEDVTDTDLRLRVLAGELVRLEAEVDWLRRQAFPHTATGAWLERHGEARGVERAPAACAEGRIRFSRYLPLSFDLVIPAGTVCATSGEEPVEVVTTKDAVLPTGELSVEAPARAAVGGREGNLGAGYVNTLVSQTTGVQYITNPAPFTGGREQEDDEAYRLRVLAAYAHLPTGSNVAWYRDAALAVPGVASVEVVPRENGVNTVGLYVWGDEGAPSDALLSAVSARVAARREIGVTVAVQAARSRAVNVTARVRLQAGADFTAAREAVLKALEGCFAGLSVGSALYLAELERVILNAAPVTGLEFPVTMADIPAQTGTIPVAGTLRVEELA